MPALPSGRRRTNGRSGCVSRQTIVTPNNTADHWLQVFIATQAASEPIPGPPFFGVGIFERIVVQSEDR